MVTIDALDVLRWLLYAVTVGLGAALIAWVARDRSLRRRGLQRITDGPVESPGALADAGPGAAQPTIAEALAGIRLPVHWTPRPSPEVVSPLALITADDTPEEVARVLSDELVRLGYRVRPIAVNAARALRDSHYLTVQVDTAPSGVTATITLTGQIIG